MKIARAFLQFSFQLEYSIIEIITRLPCSKCLRLLFLARGVLNFLFDRDWRSLLDPNLSVRNYSAKVLAVPQFSWDSLARFVSYSLEEHEVLSLRNSKGIKKELFELECKCKKRVVEQGYNLNSTDGLVILSLHYGSFTLGMLALKCLGKPIYVLGSNVVESPDLPPAIRKFFQLKYDIMSGFMNGGEVLYLEKHKKDFFSQIKKGAVGVALCDLLANKNNSNLRLNFFGEKKRIQAGVAHFAFRKNLPIGFFLCRRIFGRRIIFEIKLDQYYKHNLEDIVQYLFTYLFNKSQFTKKHWLISDSFYNA
jgi:lauroyl/myristoyl acyltransferase